MYIVGKRQVLALLTFTVIDDTQSEEYLLFMISSRPTLSYSDGIAKVFPDINTAK